MSHETGGPQVADGVFTYFGAGRNVTATHYDPYENLLLCVCGTKRLWLYPPSDARHLYPITKGPSLDATRSAAPPFKRYDELSTEARKAMPLLARAAPAQVCMAWALLWAKGCGNQRGLVMRSAEHQPLSTGAGGSRGGRSALPTRVLVALRPGMPRSQSHPQLVARAPPLQGRRARQRRHVMIGVVTDVIMQVIRPIPAE